MSSKRTHDGRQRRRRFLRDERKATAPAAPGGTCAALLRVGNLLAKCLRGEPTGQRWRAIRQGEYR
jgi:hypothetical protein